MGLQGVLVLAGTSSGVGKTSLATGLMAALRQRGSVVQAFKVGPDFLDPLHHEAATGRPSINLDGWMMTRQQNAAAFSRATRDADIAVVEGVMGLFDGRDGTSEDGSTAQIAKWLGAPVVLVLDCWAIARSAAAVVKGYTEFDPDLLIGGLLLNKVGGAAHTKWLQEAITASGVKARFLGGVPKDEGIAVKETYLGLHMPSDSSISGGFMERLADLVGSAVDMEALLSVAATARPPKPDEEPAVPRCPLAGTVAIAVARDAAFGFYYRDNLALLEAAGARLVWFSPLVDPLPDGISGIYFGGGYPEMHAHALSANSSLRAAVAAFARAGGVIYAECGGLMYLSQSLKPVQGPPASMVGIFPFRTMMTGRMKMGYVEVMTQPACRLFPPGSLVRGQIYHFSEMVHERIVSGLSNIPDATAVFGAWEHGYRATMQTPGAEPVDEGYFCDNVLASYVHLHFGSNPAFADSLVARCKSVNAAKVCSAAHAAVSSMRHVRSGSDGSCPLVDNGQIDRRRTSLSLVRSVPNLAGMPHAISVRRGYASLSDQSSEAGLHSMSTSPRIYDAASEDAVSTSHSSHSYNASPRGNAGVSSRESSYGNYSRSSGSQQEAEYRDSQATSSRGNSPQGYGGHSSGQGLKRSTSIASSPKKTPPRTSERPHSLQGKHLNGYREGQHNGFREGHLPSRSISGLLDARTEPHVTMQRSASAMVHSPSGPGPPLGRSPGSVSHGSNLVHFGTTGHGHYQQHPHQKLHHYQHQHQQQPGSSRYSPKWSSNSRAGTLERLRSSPSSSGRVDERQRHHRQSTASVTPNGSRRTSAAQRSQGPRSAAPGLANERIVSMLPSGTEILCALGLSSRVVGVSQQCEWPPDAGQCAIVSKCRVDCRQLTPAQVEEQMQAFKRQGVSAMEVDAPTLAALRPGLVLTQDACATCDADTATVQAALQRAGLVGPCARSPARVLTLHPRTIAEALDSILLVGEAAGAAAEACQLVDSCRARLRAVAQAVAAVPHRPRVLSLEGLTPLVLGGQWLPDIKEVAGGIDEWQQVGDAPLRITWDQVRRYAPEVLVLAPCGADVASATAQACDLASLPGWWSLPAVRGGAVFVADHSLFSRPGPRLVDGVEALARMLHPDVIHKRIPDGLVRKITLSNGQRCRQSALGTCFASYN